MFTFDSIVDVFQWHITVAHKNLAGTVPFLPTLLQLVYIF